MAPIEIQVLSKYLSDALLDSNQHVAVCSAFTQKLESRFFPHHWYPLEPERGSGYRAVSFDPIRQDGYLDPVLCIFAQLLAISTRDLRRIILKNLGDTHSSGWTIWCDPGCVSIRLQASGGELREIWGTLPSHLSHYRAGNSHSPPAAFTQRPSPVQSPSPNKSRAIPILAPASLTRFAVTPPTPNSTHSRLISSEGSEQEEEELNNVQAMLTDHLKTQLHLASYCSSLEDRPASRASCASSSSDGSDNSGFSSSSSSTATSIAPLGIHMTKKLSHMQLQNLVGSQYPSGFVRHNSSNSVPFASVHGVSSVGANSLAAFPRPACRAVSPVHHGQRRRHMPSSSVSSTGSGRGLLVLKGGPGTVTEHSGGKVGVMGGGVLLGLPKDKESASVVTTNHHRVPNRRTRTGPANS